MTSRKSDVSKYLGLQSLSLTAPIRCGTGEEAIRCGTGKEAIRRVTRRKPLDKMGEAGRRKEVKKTD